MQSNALQEIIEDPDFGIVLSDGTRLSARLWKPVAADATPVPLILEYLPYRKRDGTVARDALTHPWFAARGYACLRVDIRGNGDSEGLMEDEYTAQELSDAVEVIAQMAAEPWCTGAVGMMGISWGGFNSLQVAALNPAPLKAVITLCSTVDRFADDIHYKGGCLLNENLGWGATMWAYSSRAPDPALRSDWREMWLARLQAEPFLPSRWLRHQRRDAYWQHGSVCEDYKAIKARVLAVGGWGDAYKNAVPQIVENIDGAKGIVGPWVHKYPHFATPEPRIGFLQEALRWWDRWLKNENNGAENLPDYRAYLMDGQRPSRHFDHRPGRWVAEEYGAATHMPHRALHLTNQGLSDGPGKLHAKVCSPQDCGADAGEYCAIWGGAEMPGDQRGDDATSMVFDSAPLEQDTDVFGAPRLRLKISADKPQVQIAVRLNQVHPDGAVSRITYGVLNLSHRDGAAAPALLRPSEIVRADFALDHIAYRIPAGHKLRIALSTSYWPLLWPSPEAATVTLSQASLHLPVRRTARRDETTFEPPEAAAPWPHVELRAARSSRHQIKDLNSGVASLVIEDDFGKRRDETHGLISGGIARERWDIHPDDPLSARGTCHWTEETERDDIRLRTETHSQMWSDATHFFLKARIEAYQNDALIYERDLEDRIARDHL
ncbi:MAG: CocE/NonD family hydrolase [Pseudomonadota bacterium]